MLSSALTFNFIFPIGKVIFFLESRFNVSSTFEKSPNILKIFKTNRFKKNLNIVLMDLEITEEIVIFNAWVVILTTLKSDENVEKKKKVKPNQTVVDYINIIH